MSETLRRPATANVLGVPVACHTMESLLAELDRLLAAPGCRIACGVNAHSLDLACRQPAFKTALLDADLVYADGASLALAAWFLGEPPLSKLTTTDVFPHLADRARRSGQRWFFVGGEPGLAERAADAARQRYPGLRVVGARHGYFDLEDDHVLAEVGAADADVVWVGMGEPRQLLWAARVASRLHGGLLLTCGGMFKIVAGDLRRVPERLRTHGLEWLGRLAQEPRTWRRYLLGLPRFAGRLLRQRWRPSDPAPPAGERPERR